MFGSKLSSPAENKSSPDEPLAMTVHSLPRPGEGTLERRLSGRWKMLALMLACAAPVLASYFAYYVIRPEGRKNYGQLIEPMRMIPDATGLLLNGRSMPLAALKGQWLIVSVGSGACDPACEKRIYWQRQLREVTGRDKDRIERVWLIADDAPVKEALASQVHAPANDAQALRVSGAVLAQWLGVDSGGKLDPDWKTRLYIVDPNGHLMLRWPTDLEPAKAKRDLLNLLRASASWDQAGRAVNLQQRPGKP